MAATVDSPIHVLVVENNPVDVKTVRLVLDALDLEHDLMVVRDADQAIALLNREAPYQLAVQPDLIVLGLLLPDIGGVAILQEVARLRTSGNRSIITIVGVGSDDSQSQRAAQVLGANAYFVKPTRSEESQALALKVRQLWDRFRTRGALEPKTPCTREKF